MNNNVNKTQSLSPILTYAVLFGFSLAAAIILYGFLPSTGIWESKSAKLGGAAAGFVIFFLLSIQGYLKLNNAHNSLKKEGTDGRILALEQEIERLTSLDTPDIECPHSFEKIISKDFGLGFAKPRAWESHPEQHIGIYMQPLDDKAKAAKFRGNITVTVTPISLLPGLPSDLNEISDEMLKAPFMSTQSFFLGGEVDWKSTYVANRRAIMATLNYPLQNNPDVIIIVEGAVILDEVGRQLFIFALHEAEQRADASRKLFRQLLSTVKFLP
jgi:hypothetical protein